jgi:hypothetical protein
VFLIDKVTTFANLINYNTTENNHSNSSHFKQALSELYRASDLSRFISLTELNNRTATTTSNNTVDVGILNTTFHKLNFNEENPSAGGVTFNQSTGKFSVISGRPSFIGKKITVIAPLKELITGNNFVFNFKNTLVLNNSTTAIKTLVVDFADGNAASTVISNSTIVLPTKTVNYTTSGAKTLKFTLTYSDNSTLITYGYAYVNYESNMQTFTTNPNGLVCYELLKDKGTFISTIPYQGYTESSPVYGKTEYTIFYGENNSAKQMLKPIIIVDGFDPKDKRKVQDCDCENDTTPAPNNCKLNNSDITINWNATPPITITFNPEKHESLEDLMYYNEVVAGNNVRKNLIQELRTKGYDVVIINNPTYTTTNVAGQIVTVDGGADYIERNAMTLVSFIKEYVKGKQDLVGSTEKLVLIGPSMGGQITRYALAYMEKKFEETGLDEWQHNTRLWVSVDSPHLGANIPVGAQANIWFLADRLGKEPAKIQYYEELNSVAGKQQIISQFKNARETGFLNGNSFFTTYYNNLNSNGAVGSGGYPVSNANFRKIAMANGSLTGKKDAIEQQTFLYMRGYIRGFWPFQSSTITLLRLQDNFMPASGQTATVFKGDGQNSTFNIGFNHWYIDFSHPRYSLSVNNNSIKGSMDVVPGGTFTTAKYIKEAVSEGLREAGVRQETRDYIENHSFISTFSAIGHLNPNQNWGNPLNTNLTCSSNRQIPFDSYYGTENNTEHTSFTKESIDWLFKELDGIPQAPSFPIVENAFSGPSTICLDANTLFSFGDVCKLPSAGVWSVSSNLELISATDFSLIVKGIANGEGTITATFQNGQVFTKTIWVGAPQLNQFIFGNGLSQSNCITPIDCLTLNLESTEIYASFSGMSTTEINTNSNWEWVRENNLIMLNSSRNRTQVCPLSIGYSGFKVRAKNACGWSEWSDYPSFEITECPTNNFRLSSNTYTIYPNPSKDIINIDLRDQNKKPERDVTISGELFDMMGQSKSKVEIIHNKATFSVRDLNKGIYVLKIYINNQVESHQIAVE